MSELERLGDSPQLRAAIEAAREAALRSPEELAVYEAAVARDRRRDLLKSAGLGQSLTAEDHHRIVDDATVPTAALKLVQHWTTRVLEARAGNAVPQVRVLVVAGGTGVGKTVAAGWMLAREVGRHHDFDDLVASFSSRFGPDRKLYLRARAVPFLHVDEMLATDPTDEHVRCLHDLVHHRQRGQLTLITGNFELPAWDALLDLRTRERLGPMTYVRAVKGTSLRKPLEHGRLPDRGLS